MCVVHDITYNATKSILLISEAFSSNWHVFFGISKNKLLDFPRSKSLIMDSKWFVEQVAGRHKPSEILASVSSL